MGTFDFKKKKKNLGVVLCVYGWFCNDTFIAGLESRKYLWKTHIEGAKRISRPLASCQCVINMYVKAEWGFFVWSFKLCCHVSTNFS